VWSRPGELLHLDVRKLGRILKVGHRITGNPRDTVDGAGRGYVRVAIVDFSRVANCPVLPDEEVRSASAFLRAAPADCAGLGVTIHEVHTDNGVCYKARRSAATCVEIGVRHRPHASLAGRPPTSRLSLNRNNLLRLHIYSLRGNS